MGGGGWGLGFEENPEDCGRKLGEGCRKVCVEPILGRSVWNI